MTSLLETYVRASQSVTREHTRARLTLLEGSVPKDLRGVLFRNGPGKMEVFGEPYGHPFDGDGMVTRFSFDDDEAAPDGSVHYTNRFVQTAELKAEARAGRMLYRSFGTNLPGGLRKNFLRLHFKNAANTSVVQHAGRLLALWEGGLPHALDPATLETEGLYDFDGALQNPASRLARLFAPHLPFSAHPKRDVDTGELWNFGTLLGRRHHLVIHRVERTGHLPRPRFVPLDALPFVHDFTLTERFSVFVLPAVAFDVLETFLGRATPVSSLHARAGEPSTLMLVPRDPNGEPRSFRGPPGFVFHFANGFEDDRGRVVLDAMWMPSLPRAEDVHRFLAGEDVALPIARPVRLTVDLERGTVDKEPISEIATELPTVDPRLVGRPYQAFWALAGEDPGAQAPSPFSTRIARVEPERGVVRSVDFAPDLPGEPLFVPKPSGRPEEGWLTVLVYRGEAHRSELVVLDASTLAIVCRLALPHHVPPGFHGTWVPAA